MVQLGLGADLPHSLPSSASQIAAPLTDSIKLGDPREGSGTAKSRPDPRSLHPREPGRLPKAVTLPQPLRFPSVNNNHSRRPLSHSSGH